MVSCKNKIVKWLHSKKVGYFLRNEEMNIQLFFTESHCPLSVIITFQQI